MNNAVALALLIAAALPGCSGGTGDLGQPPLAGSSIGGPFKLTDQDGRAVTERSYAGRYRLMYFGYTYCPDVCPTALQTLMGGYHLLKARDPAAAARLVPLFVTVDPERDTPAVMKRYVAAFGPELIGLTGTPAQIAETTKRFAVMSAKRQTPGASGYLMDHLSVAMLFGPNGAPIAIVPEDGGREAVADELAKWVR